MSKVKGQWRECQAAMGAGTAKKKPPCNQEVRGNGLEGLQRMRPGTAAHGGATPCGAGGRGGGGSATSKGGVAALAQETERSLSQTRDQEGGGEEINCSR